jgi:hypothetical protein
VEVGTVVVVATVVVGATVALGEAVDVLAGAAVVVTIVEATS